MYFSTAEFIIEPFLKKNNRFTASCEVTPLMVYDGVRPVAQCLLIYNEGLPAVQLGFFEALAGVQPAVDMLVGAAKDYAKDKGTGRIIIGLNGHISYGVGILTSGFDIPNSFDSIYNKPYYAEYFESLGCKKETLSTYKAEISQVASNLPQVPLGGVWAANLGQFDRELEKMRLLCNKTIGKTYLYFKTAYRHFYDLMHSLKPFLKNENLLFSGDGQDPSGFLFWHPDYNQMLSGGRMHSIAGIGLRYLLYKKRIDTVKLNAIGVTAGPAATNSLIKAMAGLTQGKYKYVETNFIWDNNEKSSSLARRLLGEPHRRYSVYIMSVPL